MVWGFVLYASHTTRFWIRGEEIVGGRSCVGVDESWTVTGDVGWESYRDEGMSLVQRGWVVRVCELSVVIGFGDKLQNQGIGNRS